MADTVYLNVPAHACMRDSAQNGLRLVRYNGGSYSIIGLYLVPVGAERIERVLFYILRLRDAESLAGLSARDGG